MNNELIGKVLRVLGCGLLFAAYMMDTTVDTGVGKVYNIGLLSQQNNLSLIGALSLIAGIFIYVMTRKEPKKDITESEIEENLKADREDNELKQQLAAEENLYSEAGEKASDRLTGFDLTIFWSPLILAALFSDQTWWVSGFLILVSFLFLGYKISFYKKQIIDEVKTSNRDFIGLPEGKL